MTLSNKQKALVATISLVIVSVIVGLGMQFIAENVDPKVILYTVYAGMAGWLLYIVYAILLARFEYEEKIQKVVDNK